MVGGLGNDTYVIHSISDNVTELAGGGTADRVKASVSFTLAAGDNIEFLETINASLTTSLNLTGNEVAQTITGNAGNNILNGGVDNVRDSLVGGFGNDTYVIHSAIDNITELAGGGTTDRAKASVSFVLAAGDDIEFLETTDAALTKALNLTGNEIAQTITGNAGANVLNGGVDIVVDTLIGGLGNDTYVINTANDNIIESAGGGIADRAKVSVSFTLAAGDDVEFLETTNAGLTTQLNLTGNAIAQIITGNAGINILNGGVDDLRDTLIGGSGDDTYVINSTTDNITEFAGGGTADRAKVSVNFTLAVGDNIEILETTNAALTTALNLTGNEIAQTVIGNRGNNILNGGRGNDILTGGVGNDTFRFDTTLGATNIDTITDFNVVQDTIELENTIFTLLTAGSSITADQFRNLALGVQDATDVIIYDQLSGSLYYDSNGLANGGQKQFAQVTAGTVLANLDFLVT